MSSNRSAGSTPAEVRMKGKLVKDPGWLEKIYRSLFQVDDLADRESLNRGLWSRGVEKASDAKATYEDKVSYDHD